MKILNKTKQNERKKTMKKEKAMAMLVLHLNALAENDLMNVDRKTDQGYGFSQGMIAILEDSFFDDISNCCQMWLSAMHPAYKTTFEEWKNKYKEHFNYDFWAK